MQSDPIGLAGGLNNYGYGNVNPLLFVDPDGLSGVVVGGPRVIPGTRPMEMVRPRNSPFDPAAPFPDTGQPGNEPPSPKCLVLADKISNLKKEIYEKRIPDLQANPSNLPERIGPGEQLRQTVRGHRTLLHDRLRRLKQLEERFDRECSPRC